MGYDNEGKELEAVQVYSPVPKRHKGRPKVEGETKEWDIRITPTDQSEVDFAPFIEDFKILLVCKEGEPNGKPRLHYHMYAVTTRSDSYIDTLLNKIGKSTQDIKGNAVFSKRKKHDGTIGYVVKSGNVVLRHGCTDQFITESFKVSEDYRKRKESERKSASRGAENFLGDIMKEDEVKRLTDPLEITRTILKRYKDDGKRLPNRSAVESAVMTLMYDHDKEFVERFYTRSFLTY